MPDDRSKTPRARIWGDDKRAGVGRMTRTPGGGLAIPEPIESELTPPPQPPPGPEALATMPLVQRIDMIGDSVAKLTEAFGKVWDERGNGERITRLEVAVAGYTKQIELHQETIDKLVLPAIKHSTARIETLLMGRERTDQQLKRFFETDLKKLEDVIDKLADSTASLADRLGKLEFSANQLHASDVTLQAQISKAHDTIALIDSRVAKLEKHNETGAIERAERTRIFSFARALAFGAIGAIGAVISNLDDIASWLT